MEEVSDIDVTTELTNPVFETRHLLLDAQLYHHRFLSYLGLEQGVTSSVLAERTSGLLYRTPLGHFTCQEPSSSASSDP